MQGVEGRKCHYVIPSGKFIIVWCAYLVQSHLLEVRANGRNIKPLRGRDFMHLQFMSLEGKASNAVHPNHMEMKSREVGKASGDDQGWK